MNCKKTSGNRRRATSQVSRRAPYRGRIEAALRARIRDYEACVELLGNLDPASYQAGRDLFEDDAALAEWLCDPAMALGGKIPLRVMGTAAGQRKVAELLRAIGQGVFL